MESFFCNFVTAFLLVVSTEMNYYDFIEYDLVLIGWVVALLLGSLLLLIKLPVASTHRSYVIAKNTCGLAMLLLGVEIFFQWLLRFYLEFIDPILSVSVYLFTYWLANLLFTWGFSSMLAPRQLSRRKRHVLIAGSGCYLFVLLCNYFVLEGKAQAYGVLIACVLLFLLTCASIYVCVITYRRAINNLRTYYSDVVEKLMRWMPGVGFGIMLLLLSAPISCLAPRWVGINHLAFSIIMFIYTFVCIISFSMNYNKVAVALTDDQQCGGESADHAITSDSPGASDCSLSESLLKVLFDKEKRWQELGGYRIQGLTIDQVAREMGTNRSYLSKFLNETRHESFYEWINRMRIAEAKSLMLDDSSLSIEQVAKHVGFASASTFYNAFKKFEGISPKKWRDNL